jgi:transposase
VRLIPAQYVKPYVKTNKNDYIDAEAIAEAVARPTMRFVPIKSDDQLDLQSLHRVRERWVTRRTAVINQIRGLLLERGITLRKGRRYLDEALPRNPRRCPGEAVGNITFAANATKVGTGLRVPSCSRRPSRLQA